MTAATLSSSSWLPDMLPPEIGKLLMRLASGRAIRKEKREFLSHVEWFAPDRRHDRRDRRVPWLMRSIASRVEVGRQAQGRGPAKYLHPNCARKAKLFSD